MPLTGDITITLKIPFVEKIFDAIKQGTGKALEPYFRKKMVDADVYGIDAYSDALRRNDDIPIRVEKDGVLLNSPCFDLIADRTSARVAWQESLRERNIEAILEKTLNIVHPQEKVSSEPVDEDWITRFFRYAEDINNEEMRKIWAYVLATEIKKPRTFSMRTLEVLKNISHYEAELFQRVSALSLEMKSRRILIYDSNIFHDFEIRLDDLRLLDEAGLLVCDLLTVVESNFSYDTVLEMNCDSLLVYVLNEESKTGSFRIRCIQYTVAGRELANALELNSNADHILQLIKTLDYDKSIFRIEAHPITKDNEGNWNANMGIDLLKGV